MTNTFNVKGKEYELKLDYQGVKYLNKLYEGGTFELISKAIMGDFDTFPHIVKAALIHTKKNFTVADIEAEVDRMITAEELDMDGIIKMSNKLVNDNFFYKATVGKLLKDNPEAQKLMKQMTE